MKFTRIVTLNSFVILDPLHLHPPPRPGLSSLTSVSLQQTRPILLVAGPFPLVLKSFGLLLGTLPEAALKLCACRRGGTCGHADGHTDGLLTRVEF